MRSIHLVRRGALPLGLVLLAGVSVAQDSPPGGSGGQGPGAGVSREEMWYAPTAADWQKPCLIQWQRTWEDALAISRATMKPLLVCVNMDGEIASEHYAGVRYREPETAALYDSYVCVIASVYRHNPRDYDDEGRRIPCPRFGTVTCGEHIHIEPALYERFFDDRRVAPRHVAVELDGAETYDVFYAWDTASVFTAIEKGITERTIVTVPLPRDGTPIRRIASKDSLDRAEVEQAYLAGDAAQRRELLDAALALGPEAPVDLLRLAIFGYDEELSRTARRVLAQSSAEQSVGLIADALRVPLPAPEREALIGALERLSATSPWARTLAAVHRGLARESREVDVEAWSRALAETPEPEATDRVLLQYRLESGAERTAAQAADPETYVDLAEAYLELAVDPRTERRYARVLTEDARRAGLEAERLGARGWRVNAALAVAAARLGEQDEARTRAEAAVGDLPAEVESKSAVTVLALFAEARRQAIAEAMREKRAWPDEWLADVRAAYAVLARHPLGSDVHALAQYDFLCSLNAAGAAERALDEALARFPDSWELHERLRRRVLAAQGPAGLEAVYAARLREAGASPNLEWFAGYAALVAAELHRRANEADPALASYGRALAHYDRAIASNPDSRDTADHYAALALAGRARVAYEQGDDERALAELLACFARKPAAAATPDGLNLTPVGTAKMVLARLAAAQRTELAQELSDALAKLDPVLLELPAYERELPDARSRGGRGRGN